MSKPLIFMFSGEGTQYFNMGRHDYANIGIFKKYCDKLDEYLRDTFSFSMLSYIFSDSKSFSDKFDNISYSHPALFIIQYATAQTLLHHGYIPSALIGVSLGEIIAAVIAGVMSWEEGLALTVNQSRYVQKYCQTGAMLAILDSKDILIQMPELYRRLEVASDNFKNHFVISGDEESIKIAEEKLFKLGVTTHKISTQYAFHSNKMESMKSFYLEYLTSIKLTLPKYRFYSCEKKIDLTALSANHFWDVIRQPIYFRQMIIQLENSPFQYIDVGPSGTLSTFVKYNITKNSESSTISSMLPCSKLTIVEQLKKQVLV